jgi:hypothetical protein
LVGQAWRPEPFPTVRAKERLSFDKLTPHFHEGLQRHAGHAFLHQVLEDSFEVPVPGEMGVVQSRSYKLVRTSILLHRPSSPMEFDAPTQEAAYRANLVSFHL